MTNSTEVGDTGVRILVTNDDGIDSPGLHALARRLTALGEVTVFAPTGNLSGAGASIGHIGPGIPDVFEADRPEIDGALAAYHFDGPPALATMLACTGIFGPLPDIVVSGINPGWNVGHAVHFSGTIGACITADVFGLPAIAVSQAVAGTNELQRWDTAADVAASLVPELLASPRLLNVNVPNLLPEAVEGTRRTVLADRLPYSLSSPTLTATGEGRHAANFERFGPFESPEGSDTFAVEAGYVSITPLTPTRAAVPRDGAE